MRALMVATAVAVVTMVAATPLLAQEGGSQDAREYVTGFGGLAR